MRQPHTPLRNAPSPLQIQCSTVLQSVRKFYTPAHSHYSFDADADFDLKEASDSETDSDRCYFESLSAESDPDECSSSSSSSWLRSHGETTKANLASCLALRAMAESPFQPGRTRQSCVQMYLEETPKIEEIQRVFIRRPSHLNIIQLKNR